MIIRTISVLFLVGFLTLSFAEECTKSISCSSKEKGKSEKCHKEAKKTEKCEKDSKACKETCTEKEKKECKSESKEKCHHGSKADHDEKHKDDNNKKCCPSTKSYKG